MNLRGLAGAVALAVVLYVLIPTVLFPIFYLFISPSLGCKPVGSASQLFNLNALQNPAIVGVCTASPELYYGMLAYFVVIMIIIGVLIFNIHKALLLVLAGSFAPALIYIANGLGYLKAFNSLADIIMLFVVGMGVLIAGVFE